jgi:membrane dipeptidase
MGEKKIAAMIGVEGGHMIEDRIDYLDSLYKRGARYLTLTWNNSTSWASSAADENNPRSGLKHKGLTEKGKEIVRRMNELGMMVDLAHVGYQTYFDAIKTSTKPVLVSHSNAYAIAKVSRNLRDDQIKAITENGGVICVNFYSGFLDEKYRAKIDALYKKYVDPKGNDKLSSDAKYTRIPSKGKQELRPPLETLIDHIDHMVQLAGIDHVGIGGDFDGMESTPIGLDDVSDYPNLTKALLKRGYKEPDIIKILGGNVLRVIQAQGN